MARLPDPQRSSVWVRAREWNWPSRKSTEAGGINGRKLEVLFEDDNFSPARALAAVKKLIEQDKIFMIFGLSGSNPTVGTLEYVKDLKIPNYFTVASAPPITHPYNRYLFRGATVESGRYGEVYSEFFTQFLKVKKIAIVSGADENAKNEADHTSRYLEKWYDVKALDASPVQGRRQGFHLATHSGEGGPIPNSLW